MKNKFIQDLFESFFLTAVFYIPTFIIAKFIIDKPYELLVNYTCQNIYNCDLATFSAFYVVSYFVLLLGCELPACAVVAYERESIRVFVVNSMILFVTFNIVGFFLFLKIVY